MKHLQAYRQTNQGKDEDEGLGGGGGGERGGIIKMETIGRLICMVLLSKHNLWLCFQILQFVALIVTPPACSSLREEQLMQAAISLLP